MTRLLTMIVAVAALARLVAADETIVSAPEPVSTAQATTDFGSYSYDGAGNITAVGDDTFSYDAFGRISTAAVKLGSATRNQTFTYDRYGNIRKITTTSQPDYVPAVDERTNRTDLTTSGTNAVAKYDAAGNVILLNGSDKFVYDPLDVVTESTLGVERNVYLYNASNERIATLKVAGSAVTSSKWTLRDASAKVLRRLSKDASGTWRWDEDYIYRGTQLLAAEIPGNTLHFHPDHLGTPRVITGHGGARLSEHKYYPFGAELTSPGTEVMKFTGHERDAPNLDYMHARYYMPYGGRFLSVDPVLDVKRAMRHPQMWNRYAYVSNNPMNATDPDGRAENRVDNQLYRDQLAVIHGEMTMEQYNANNAARFNGAMAGLSIVQGVAALRSVAGFFFGSASGLARGSIGLDAAIARGAVREGGALGKIISGIEAGFRSGAPKSAEKALELVAKSAEAAGKEPGTLVKATEGAKYVLQNVGDVKTFIYKTGEVIVKKGDDILVRYIPK